MSRPKDLFIYLFIACSEFLALVTTAYKKYSAEQCEGWEKALEAETGIWHISQGRALIAGCHLGHQGDPVRRQHSYGRSCCMVCDLSSRN